MNALPPLASHGQTLPPKQQTVNMLKPTLYYWGVVGVGSFLAFQAVGQLPRDLWEVVVLWSFFCILSELKPIPVSTSDYISVSFAIHLSAVFLWGFPAATVSTIVGSAVTDLLLRRGFKKVLFNVSQYAITIWLAAHTFSMLRRSTGLLDLEEDVIALLSGCLVYSVVNSFLVAAIIALTQQERLRDVWFGDFRFEAFHYVALTPLSALIALLYQLDPYYIFLITIPLILTHAGFQTYSNHSQQARETIELLADALDRRDPYTAHHSSRVARLAAAIAREMKLPERVVKEIEMGGRVHDLGKIGIPESILNKRSKLTSKEFDCIKDHPQEGYKLLSRLHLYSEGLTYVLHHHERMDGLGYPDGLSGEQIPLGARIISVADAFDAMTSNRPYRAAMTREQAIKELQRNSGTQFDPRVVEAVIRVLSSSEDK